jgi:hypothetical protein
MRRRAKWPPRQGRRLQFTRMAKQSWRTDCGCGQHRRELEKQTFPQTGEGPLPSTKPKIYSGKNTGPVRLLLQCSGGVCRASCRRRFHSPDLLARWRGEGGVIVICESMPLDNGSSNRAQIQHEDGLWCSAPLLFGQDCLTLTGDFWRALASLYSKARL